MASTSPLKRRAVYTDDNPSTKHIKTEVERLVPFLQVQIRQMIDSAIPHDVFDGCTKANHFPDVEYVDQFTETVATQVGDLIQRYRQDPDEPDYKYSNPDDSDEEPELSNRKTVGNMSNVLHVNPIRDWMFANARNNRNMATTIPVLVDYLARTSAWLIEEKDVQAITLLYNRVYHSRNPEKSKKEFCEDAFPMIGLGEQFYTYRM